MYLLEKIKIETAHKINEILQQVVVTSADLEYPQNPDYGHIVWPSFKALKILNMDPVKIKGELIDGGLCRNGYIVDINQIGPYFNFIFSDKSFIASELDELFALGKAYGSNETGEKERVMVEYCQPNTHKEFHVGHLRNLCLGNAVFNIMTFNGFDAIPVSYINDFGINVAKTLWLYNKKYIGQEPNKNRGSFLAKIYAEASNLLKKDEEGMKEVLQIKKEIESRVGETYELWRKTKDWSIEQFESAYRDMGVKFDHTFYESELVNEGIDIVESLIERGILKKSDGAIIADLEEYGLGVLVVLRSDGTALYPVADIPLAMIKFKKYSISKSVYLVDMRQDHYFRQLFKILELMGFDEKIVHLSYELVKLPSGMMSSRTGNVITYDYLKEQALKKAVQEIRLRHIDWKEDKIAETARKIMFGAIKFEMIKVKSDQMITFDTEEALRFDGCTALYLQYSFARISGIIRKSGIDIAQIEGADTEALSDKKELCLALKLAKYFEAVKIAGDNYDPSVIARYLFELAQNFNDYYQSVRVLDVEDKKLARLKLIRAVSLVIENGLDLLGIEIMEEM